MTPRQAFLEFWAPFRLTILPDAAAVEEHVLANLVFLADQGVLAKTTLASGATFAGIFRRIRRLVDSGYRGFEDVAFHHLDEFEGLTASSPGSLAGEIVAALFPDQEERRGWFTPADARPGGDSIAAHEKNVAGSTLALLGLGANGHVAFNEPGTPFDEGSHFASLTAETRAAHASRFRGGRVPERALTAGINTILSAQSIMLVATGVSKARAVADMMAGPLAPSCPASALRLHDRVEVVLDEEAASELAAIPIAAIGMNMTMIGRRSKDPPGPTLVVAPHPDDASISCGGLLAVTPERSKRHIVTFSTGARAIAGAEPDQARALRERESTEEARILGASLSFLRAKAYDSGGFEPDDSAAMLAVLEQVQPARILVPSRRDPHPTHRLCRITIEEAVRAWLTKQPRFLEIWTYEGPWCLHDAQDINVLVLLDAQAHDRKQAGIKAHKSQISRVPFHVGADALEKLRAISFSESHLGGRDPRGFDPNSRLECYQRFVIGPDEQALAQYSQYSSS